MSSSQFLRNFGWRLLLLVPLLGWVIWREGEYLPELWQQSLWAQMAIGGLVVIALIVAVHQLMLVWRAAHTMLVLTPSEAWLFQRRGGRIYFERMTWQECLPPELPRGWRVLEVLGDLLHIVSHIGLQPLVLLLPERAYELRLRSRYDPRRRWQVALVGAHYHPRFALTYVAAHALHHWLSSGDVRLEPGYEPSPKRPFLALDLKTRTLRAYAFREVRLDEGGMQVEVRHESYNPDGTRVESDHTLSADTAHAEQVEQSHVRRFELPAFAVRYGDYWLRADWDLIKRIESRRTASETATLPVQLSKPA